MPVPNIFGTATSAIPLSQLDTNFATPVTIGNTAVQLGNTVTSFGNVTLTNVTISSGNVTVSSGSNTAPSITTVGDTNTGIFFPAADTIAFTEGGIEAARINSSGVFTTTNDATIQGLTVGRGAGAVATNTAVGASALAANTSGANNTAVGQVSMDENTTGSINVAFGVNTLGLNTTGSENSAIGVSSLSANTTGSYNTALGRSALGSNTTASYNTASGYQAGYSNTTGAQNVFSGAFAGYNNTTGSYNTALGYNAYAVSGTAATGNYNTAIGNGALNQNTTASENTAVGYQAEYTNTTGGSNTATGYQALYTNSSGSYNTATGWRSLYLSTTASYNTAYGYASLYSNTTGAYNVALGMQALTSNTTASYNTAVGYQSLSTANRTADADGYNTALGYLTGQILSTGQKNTFVGAQAGSGKTTGNFNICLGFNLYESSAGVSNSYVIGSNIPDGGANTIKIGNGSGYIQATYTSSATWTFTSDVRTKTQIQDDNLGLSFINRLQPKTYKWKPSNELPKEFDLYREENLRDTETVMHGLVAQDVKEALDAEGVSTFEGWSQSYDGMQMVSREMFVLPLINAIKELKADLDATKAEIAALKGTA